VAERYHLSGVLAALTAGLVVGNFGAPNRISKAGRHALEIFWEYMAFIATPLIFILIGAQEAQEHFIGLWIPILVAIALVTLGGAVATYPVCLLFVHSRLKVERRDQHILFWGGLRGALALALALPASALSRCNYHPDVCSRRLLRIRAGADDYPLLRRLGQILSD
jgi:monovalent cation:H+ antiporter, CPA1 family